MQAKRWELNLYSFYDHTGMERHLEKMAAKGWLLESIGTTLWRYRRIEPQRLRFSVAYYPDATESDPITPSLLGLLRAGGLGPRGEPRPAAYLLQHGRERRTH